MILFLLACTDHSLSILYDDPLAGEAHLLLTPPELDFGARRSDEITERTVTLQSVGSGVLYVSDLETDHPAFTVADDAPFELEPGESTTRVVRFQPIEVGEQQAHLWVTSDDADEPEQSVLLVGDGRTPYLQITPDPHDFGAMDVGCQDAVELTLQNIGIEDLAIADLWSEGADFTLEHDLSLPVELGPGAYEHVTVHFQPGSDGALTGQLFVDSDDPRGLVSASQLGEGVGVDTVTDVFAVDEDPPVDLLFAVDQSASMDDDAQALAENFEGFVDALETATGRWRIAVVTYDHGCANNGLLRPTTDDVGALFQEAVQAGEDREIEDDEALFKLVDRALDQTSAGQCNAGFQREDALLHLIVVSDEPERSAEQASAWTWDFWVPRFEEHVASADRLRISGVVDVDDCNEGDDGYADAIAATGGVALSICEDDWAAHVAAIANASLVGSWSYDLTQAPVPSSLQVSVDGTAQAGGWSYDAERNAVTFDDLIGAESVEVRYAIQSPCD